MKNINLAILTDVYGNQFGSFVAAASELKRNGITKLVIDLSSVPDKEKLEYMSVLMGVFVADGFEVRYIGINKKKVKSADWGIHKRYALLATQKNLESAVQSFN